ncbi:hypothetical protein SAMN02745830_01378 [Streptomyces sp. Amel2xC10]|nr:hypothetical protein SAMN02745830_01378 [Streptomyces sp. Amel2xC10]
MNVDELFTGDLIIGVPAVEATLLDKMPGGDNNGDHCK